MKRWQSAGGDWSVRDKAITPAARDAETWAFTGDPSWTDYTIRLRARKVGGREGFIVILHAADGDNYRWWNIGGWGNTLARCEAAEGGGREPYGAGTPFTVETGRWYDLRLEVTGRRVRGFIDDKLVTEATYEPAPTRASALATATYDKCRSHRDREGGQRGQARRWTRRSTSAAPGASSRTAPRSCSPATPGRQHARRAEEGRAPTGDGRRDVRQSFRHAFPPHSLTILRLKTSAR